MAVEVVAIPQLPLVPPDWALAVTVGAAPSVTEVRATVATLLVSLAVAPSSVVAPRAVVSQVAFQS